MDHPDPTGAAMPMRRSDLNAIIADGLEFIDRMGMRVPAFARWAPADWRAAGPEYDEVRETMLGWDVSDFGTGDFASVGLLILTLRNGSFTDDRYVKPYAEKVLIQREGQVLPFHFHWQKREDIINRGGGILVVELANVGPDKEFLDTPVRVSIDGRDASIERGSTVRLTPGESITIPPRHYHRFWGEAGSGTVLVGEVSTVNDDRVDNYVPEYGGRLPAIVEDEPARFLLFSDYPRLAEL